MPTAAKLFAALCFAALGWYASHVYSFGLPEGSRVGYLREATAFIGVLCAWRISGALAGKGYVAAMGTGIRTGITMVFFTLLVFAIYEMVSLSTKMRYDGPMEAVLGVFDLMLEYGALLLKGPLLVILLGGSALAGMVTEAAGRLWR
jgi:hypothetical protein